MGYVGGWVCEPGVHSDSVRVFVFWPVDEEEESVLSAVGGEGDGDVMGVGYGECMMVR